MALAEHLESAGKIIQCAESVISSLIKNLVINPELRPYLFFNLHANLINPIKFNYTQATNAFKRNDIAATNFHLRKFAILINKVREIQIHCI